MILSHINDYSTSLGHGLFKMLQLPLTDIFVEAYNIE